MEERKRERATEERACVRTATLGSQTFAVTAAKEEEEADFLAQGNKKSSPGLPE